MKLVFKESGKEVTPGTAFEYQCGDGEIVTLTVSEIQRPRHSGSTGRVVASKDGERGWQPLYPSVYGMHWVDREDQPSA